MSESGLQLRTEVSDTGQLTLRLQEVQFPAPGEHEVLVKVEASPINPSDLGLLFGPADLTQATFSGTAELPEVTAQVPESLLRQISARADQSLPAGNEGAGQVIAAGSSDAAQSLLGKTVAILGGAMYAQYRVLKANQCLLMNEGVSARQGASCFVNPLTALGMVATMREEGHSALLHTAAASNLGQMLVKICLKDQVPLVNVVRKAENVELLKSLGAQHVLNSSDDDFMESLIAVLTQTNATIGFDATGGGKLGGLILTAMEAAQAAKMGEFSRYGSTQHKQLYIYGGLDRSPTSFNRSFGMAWGLGGWLLTPFLQKIGPAAAQVLRQRVADEITTTFSSHYTQSVSLPEMLARENIEVYARQATREKFLVTPHG
ncbi:MAG: zinc-binding dehydrogenase [Pseudomonadota bacterium]|jgi:NADPH2:quinone reductase|nr:zinc-binding dehydrogenase [Pseudomonadota bacterium]MEC8821636.1 zinc-binding dehydrogenase [Pseudomonadota bacterium]